MNDSQHPRHRLDELIHTPVRLSVMAALAAADALDFRHLRDFLEVSDSLLSKHIAVLEEAGYVRVEKGFEGKRPRTWLSLTDIGRKAYDDYIAALRSITQGAEV
ncbi:MAG TPA: transcriptional regulator [Acidimicrobiia bacterium]|jgi:DNA-binding MarR family transcriptional regulator